MSTIGRSLSQQQNTLTSQGSSDYYAAFNNRVIPVDLSGHRYVNAQNVKFTDSTDHVATDLVLVDSAYRNWDKEENNNYTIFLGQELQYVHSIELVDGFVPNSGYVINENNNLFFFQETKAQFLNKTYYTAKIPLGDYDITTLLNQLKVSMKEASHSESTYICMVDKITNRVTIGTDDAIGTGIFNLIFTDGMEVIGDRGYIETMVIDPITGKKERKKVETSNSRRRYIDGSVAQIIGFKALNLTGLLSYTGTMVYTLRPYEYIALFVNTENSEDFKKVIAPGPDNGADKAFAIIHLDHEHEYFNSFACRRQIIENVRYIRTFNPPISFSKIKICYKTPDGNYYNFNGLDNYLLFEVKRVFNRAVIEKLDQLK